MLKYSDISLYQFWHLIIILQNVTQKKNTTWVILIDVWMFSLGSTPQVVLRTMCKVSCIAYHVITILQ